MPPYALIALGMALTIAAVLFLANRRRAASGRPGLFAREEEEQVRDQLSRLAADIQDLAREHIARLDTKIRTLQQLLAEADERIAALRSAGPAPAPPSSPAAHARPANPLHDRVYALADAGKDVGDICTETGMDQGDVELILGLRKVGSR